MTVHRRRGVSFFLSSIPIAAIAMASLSLAAASANEPDIPKIQADAERGAIAQEIQLGAAYLTGQGVPRDMNRAAYWYEKAANSGDPGAQLEIGYLYQAGIGVDRSSARAAQWFQRAASSGLTTAKVNLGVAYVWGLGVRKDPEFAAQLFREAAKKGNGSGACYLGDLYYFGLGVPRDTTEARHWFEVGSKLHNPVAKFNLASVLLDQQDRSRDGEAMKLLRASAEGGYVRAKHQVGLMLVKNPALERSPGEAVAMLEEAADGGFWKSSLLLGILARDGRSGVPEDAQNAYYHFQVAAQQGGNLASGLLAKDMQLLKSRLTDDVTMALDSKAAEWVGKHEHPLEFVNLKTKDSKTFPVLALESPDEDFHVGMLLERPFASLQEAGSTARTSVVTGNTHRTQSNR